MSTKDFFTISNLLSFARIFLVIPIVYYIKKEQNDIALIIMLVAMFTDWLDGFLARKLDQITEAGKVLDPLADKICTAGILVALSLFQGFPLWLTVFIIARDAVIIFGALMMFGHSSVVPPSNRIGKVTMFAIGLLGVAFMLGLQSTLLLLEILVAALLVFSLISYAKAFHQDVTTDEE
jgi:CDP-diacylglycerol--glycerol-3-phosphate 3-phosphatidyltransferase